MSIKKKVNMLVADSCAFIKGCNLHEMAEEIYTLEEVLFEIRDRETKQRLSCLPFQLKFREPPTEDIKWISEFAKKTGDFSSLSMVDIKLIALVYFLDKQAHQGSDAHLNKVPNQKIVVNTFSVKFDEQFRNIPGFYYSKTEKRRQNKYNEENSNQVENNTDPTNEDGIAKDLHETEGKNGHHQDYEVHVCEEVDNEDKDEVNNNDNDEDDDVDGDGSWITPQNVEEIEAQFSKITLDTKDTEEAKDDNLVVACVTSDYSIQNVLLQIGLKVVSINDGLLIRQTKQFVLRCYACSKINNEVGRKFCKYCGNLNTLKRVAVTINENGEKAIKINFKRPINKRGSIYSIPRPRGGKHADDPVLAEDQRIPQHKASKMALTEKKIFNAKSILCSPEYSALSSPFAVNDVYTQSSKFRLTQKAVSLNRRRNPNEVRPPTGNRKKRT